MGCPDVSVGMLKVGQRRLFIKDLTSEYSRYIPAIFDCRSEDTSGSEMGKSNKIFRQTLATKSYLNTEALKSNFQALLEKFRMVVIGEITKIDDV